MMMMMMVMIMILLYFHHWTICYILNVCCMSFFYKDGNNFIWTLPALFAWISKYAKHDEMFFSFLFQRQSSILFNGNDHYSRWASILPEAASEERSDGKVLYNWNLELKLKLKFKQYCRCMQQLQKLPKIIQPKESRQERLLNRLFLFSYINFGFTIYMHK